MTKNYEMLMGGVMLAGAALTGCSSGAKKCAPKPNVVFILCDDLGWGDISCYGQEKFETPNIDALAKAGMLFTQSYSGTSVSAPSRCCLVTGAHSGHAAIRGNFEIKPEGQFPLPEGGETIFKDFKSKGYTTGVFGKWGLGYVESVGNPNDQGVDQFFGINCQRLAHSYYPSHLWNNKEMVVLEKNSGFAPYDGSGEGEYSADLIHEKAMEFLDKSVADGKPFFMFYPTTIPHAELIVPNDEILQSFIGKYPETPYKGTEPGDESFRIMGYCSQEYPHATFAAMITRLDKRVGEIVAKLKELGVYENTMIIFSSDNGPHMEGGADPDFFNSNGPWRGYKRDVYEGGIRVPLIVSWPGHVAEGTTTDFMCSFWDMMPTFRKMLDPKAKIDGMDGISLLPTLEGTKGQKEHDYLYFEFLERNGSQALRKGDWKLVHFQIRSKKPYYELYNMAIDPEEQNNVIDANPEKFEELKTLMDEAHTTNPDFPLFNEEKIK